MTDRPDPDRLITSPVVEVLTRHRWVLGRISVKADRAACTTARARHGGRVDLAHVGVCEDGTEILGPWESDLPHMVAPTRGGAANPQDVPTSHASGRVR